MIRERGAVPERVLDAIRGRFVPALDVIATPVMEELVTRRGCDGKRQIITSVGVVHSIDTRI